MTVTDQPVPSNAPSRTQSPKTAPPPAPPVRLGEELPVFCEKCGYSLHGLAHTRCEHCTVLQFHCPECGHHQAINTLRPAFQAMLGRVRAGWLTMVVLLKIVVFGLLLLAWFGMGGAWSYTYDREAARHYQEEFQRQVAANAAAGKPAPSYTFRTVWVPMYEATWDIWLAFGLLGLGCGMLLRMMLLRWRRGLLVGMVLAFLIVAAMWVGVLVRHAELTMRYSGGDPDAPADILWPLTPAFLGMNALAVASLIGGASVVWGVWTMLVHAFLPPRIGKALLDWQTSLSNRVSTLART